MPNTENGNCPAERVGPIGSRRSVPCVAPKRFRYAPPLLHIDSSPLYNRSVSCELTATFVTQWKAYPISTSLICTTG